MWLTKTERTSYWTILIHTNTLPLIRVEVIMQCCLDVAGKAGQQGPHYNIILYVLMALKLLEVSDQVVEEGGEG